MRLAQFRDVNEQMRLPPPYRTPVYQTLHAVVVRPFRCQVGGICRRVEPGELDEPHFHSEIALGRVRPAV